MLKREFLCQPTEDKIGKLTMAEEKETNMNMNMNINMIMNMNKNLKMNAKKI